jgi:hypothetical protein
MFSGLSNQAPLLLEIFALRGKFQGSKELEVCGDKRLNRRTFIDTDHLCGNGLLSLGWLPGDSKNE